MKHVDHISSSAYLEIRRISSIRHLLTTKAAAQLMFFCFVVVVLYSSIGWTTATLCSMTSAVMRCTNCRKFKTMQQKLAFARADMNKLNHCSKHFTCCQSKKIQFSSYHFWFPFLSWRVLCHHICHHVSLYTILVSVRMRKKKQNPLCCARWKLKCSGYWSFSVQAPFVLNNRSAHIRHCSFSHSSKLRLKHFCLLLSAMGLCFTSACYGLL